MANFVHTPGPWTAEPSDMFGDHNIVLADSREDARAIAAVVSNIRDPHEVAANARLIASAPELLAALQVLFNSYKNLADSGDAGYWSLEDQPEGKQALAALAKARGEVA